MQIYYFIFYFFIYGFGGWCTEVAYATVRQRKFVNRGFLNGPICPVYGIGVGLVVILLESREWSLVVLYVVSTVLVTAIEGLTGYLMDKMFHHKWWDYSNRPLNIGGYVCLLFSLAWGVACVIIVRVIHPIFHKGVEVIPVTFGTAIITVLSAAVLVDLYMTVAGILNLNKKLETMEKIAAELKEISNILGENIHENVMETMELSGDARKHLNSAVSELREKLDAVSEEQRSSLITRRLIGAFPEMESRLHKEMFNELRARIHRRGN